MNIMTLLLTVVSTTLVYSAPMIFTSIGGTFSERSGIVNVGLEGIMVMGAFSSVVFNLFTAHIFHGATPWLGLLVGGLVGVLFSLMHAVATINWRTDHIISGTVLNLMAPALGVYLTKLIFAGKGQTDIIQQPLANVTMPGLSNIPVIGPIFFRNTSLVAYFGIFVAIFSWWVLKYTRFGLRLRSVGEHPEAADSVGISVYKYRYMGVMLSGLLGGIGGAIMAESITLNFSVSTIVGQGFMSLAAMIFGKWNPIGAMGAAIFFGFAQSLAIIGKYIPVIANVPNVWFTLAPYLITIIVLVAFIGKSQAPAADGSTFVKSR
ncbi:ABC transporter permease [Schleiferilactobacillus harbinensis]|jgi:simple sugar transport system permease protein|uniref:ABC transporter permease n=2 Tax=Schleiferilactobacillus harbinensis TaxID=304207 RepID=A0A510TXE7_9LACO|nr:ABC transporter permease [Schleiferilactobacillus harbinensis]HAY53001.1 ABC transporter permease [Lactobacillus sp.]KRM27596.1 sugar ABC transporter permease protein [Schleiferilactobacillus harbinensis DSM 16991]MCI1687964.1 ABC transporter permease [Schleiferilactobacillus harbinensis]MCI1782342.1 ABC transporter permease [Schleiferilactobacillus harbinensis]MCI1850209.1 ABC transporter permease [Schleiferilactobacillus harbinensis]